MSLTIPTRKNMEDHNKLLLIFIHGFKGDDETFKDFPNRLRHVLTNSINDVDTESIVYPQYETRGDLKEAVEKFCLWLEDEVKKREEEISRLNGKGSVWVCLLGHSMGGILAADTIIKYANQTEIAKPNIIGLLAFDTPYYGVHGNVFSKATMERASDLTQGITGTYTFLSTAVAASGILPNTAKSGASTSSGWGKWGLVGASVAAVGAAAYFHKDKVSNGVGWLGSHLKYVGVLWDRDELSARVENLVKVPNIVFRCYYTQIPPPKDSLREQRTFIALPPDHMMSYFHSTVSKSKDEIHAHTCMFDPVENVHYFDLGHVISAYLCEMVRKCK